MNLSKSIRLKNKNHLLSLVDKFEDFLDDIQKIKII